MHRTIWIAGAFVAGLVVSAASTRTKADTLLVPVWVQPGACYIAPSTGIEFVLEVQGVWVKTSAPADGTENWRNLAATPGLTRRSSEYCRRERERKP